MKYHLHVLHIIYIYVLRVHNVHVHVHASPHWKRYLLVTAMVRQRGGMVSPWRRFLFFEEMATRNGS